MKKKYIITIILLLSTIFITGCKTDYVEEEPKTYLIEYNDMIEEVYPEEICFVSTAYDERIEDKYLFYEDEVGNDINYYKKWSNMKSINVLNIITNRLEEAYYSGCNKIVLTDVDILDYYNGFDLTITDVDIFLSEIYNNSLNYGYDIGFLSDENLDIELQKYFDFKLIN